MSSPAEQLEEVNRQHLIEVGGVWKEAGYCGVNRKLCNIEDIKSRQNELLANTFSIANSIIASRINRNRDDSEKSVSNKEFISSLTSTGSPVLGMDISRHNRDELAKHMSKTDLDKIFRITSPIEEYTEAKYVHMGTFEFNNCIEGQDMWLNCFASHKHFNKEHVPAPQLVLKERPESMNTKNLERHTATEKILPDLTQPIYKVSNSTLANVEAITKFSKIKNDLFKATEEMYNQIRKENKEIKQAQTELTNEFKKESAISML